MGARLSPMTHANAITAYYDDLCPICRHEMGAYVNKAPDLILLHDCNGELPADIDRDAALASLHSAAAILWTSLPRDRLLGDRWAAPPSRAPPRALWCRARQVDDLFRETSSVVNKYVKSGQHDTFDYFWSTSRPHWAFCKTGSPLGVRGTTQIIPCQKLSWSQIALTGRSLSFK